MEKGLALARAYDLIAPDYEAQLARNPVAAEMRRQLQRRIDRLFRPGDRVLDFTAGTGADALYLSRRGIAVTALDASPGMIAEMVRRAALDGLRVDARVMSAEQLGELDGDFDGAISTFAGLNTIDDPMRLARDLAAHIKPHGRVVLHALNEFCLWQAVAHRLGRGEARDGQMRVGEIQVPHRLYHPQTLFQEAFAPYFASRGIYGLSVIAAPAVVARWHSIAPLLLRFDRVVGRLFPGAGDFFLMDLERLVDRGGSRG